MDYKSTTVWMNYIRVVHKVNALLGKLTRVY